MAIIDSRLLNCDTDQDVTENFNRTLALIDAGSSSGGGILYLSTEYDETADNFYLKDITKNDIQQAISDGKIIILHYTEEGLETDDMLYYFGGYNEGLNGIFFYNGSQMQTYLKDNEGIYYLDN